MKRILPLLLALPIGLFAACKGNSSNDNDHGVDPPGNGDGTETPGGGPGGSGPTAEEIDANPADVDPPTAILQVNAWSGGPVWHPAMNVLIFSTPIGEEGVLYRMTPDGRQLRIRGGTRAEGTIPIGNTVTATGELVTVEAKRIVRGSADPTADAPKVVATGYGEVTPPPVPDPDPILPDAGAPPPPAPVDGAFDTLKDVVARSDGTLYVTDPGYFADPAANRIYRISPEEEIEVVESFEDVPRPNGLALSPDERTLYVGFTRPMEGTLPFIRKYLVNEDGTLGEWTKFIDVGPDAESSPDGLAVDRVGNVYVATKAGVEIYKSDGQPWGTIPVPEQPTGLAFGGEDMKTLYITTSGEKIWQVKARVTGKQK